MSLPRYLTSLLLLAALPHSGVMAQPERDDDDILPDDLQVSYLYAAVMGTGTYKVDGRRISMLRIPIAITQQELSETEHGMKWFAPVVIGYDEIQTEDWLDILLKEKIATVTLLPGFEYQLPVNDNWVLKPFGHLGLTQDLSRHQTIGMGVAGLRALGTWRINDSAEFRWGNAIRFAAEKQFDSGEDSSFTLIETGVDYRRDTGWTVKDRQVNIGIYYFLQHYQPEWGSLILGDDDSKVHTIHQVGVSVGLRKKLKVFGVGFSRVRFGVKRGDGGYGWSLGTEFPF